jgi:hypothetical protein
MPYSWLSSEHMRARFGPLIKSILPLFRGNSGGARGTRTLACLGRLAKAKHAPGEDGGDLVSALLRGHRDRVGDGFFHCGLLADVPTTAFAWRPARCLAGLVLFVLLLHTRREFEMAVGCGRNRLLTSGRTGGVSAGGHRPERIEYAAMIGRLHSPTSDVRLTGHRPDRRLV